jgi:hypothetical protein
MTAKLADAVPKLSFIVQGEYITLRQAYEMSTASPASIRRGAVL